MFVSIISASDIIVADKSGTSDVFATAELVDTITGKPLKKARKTKTQLIKRPSTRFGTPAKYHGQT